MAKKVAALDSNSAKTEPAWLNTHSFVLEALLAIADLLTLRAAGVTAQVDVCVSQAAVKNVLQVLTGEQA